MLRIGLDVMGADDAPLAPLKGALAACPKIDAELILFGQQEVIEPALESLGGLPPNAKIVHCPEVVGMEEHPALAMKQKPNSSIAVGLGYMAKGAIDVFVSAGNTGAVTAGSVYLLKLVEGLRRPSLAAFYPVIDGHSMVLDCGANTDSKPEYLLEFAYLGSAYMQYVHGIENPKVALLNIGREASKGNQLTRETYELLSKQGDNINFIGNAEGWDLNHKYADVYVCDGYTGNVMMKVIESFYSFLKPVLPEEEKLELLNYEHIGGIPLLGVNGNIIVGHGSSSAKAFENMLYRAKELAVSDLQSKLPGLLHKMRTSA